MARFGKIAIRKAHAEDTSLLLDLIRELAVYEKLEKEVTANDQKLRESLFGANPCAEAFIASVGTEVAGFAVIFENFSTFLGKPGIYIEDIYVRSPFRGSGVGKALLCHIAGIAKERNAGRIEFAVLRWNPARHFYEHLGARPLEDWILYRLRKEDIERLGE